MKEMLSLVILCLMISACTSGNTYQYKNQSGAAHEWQPLGSNR